MLSGDVFGCLKDILGYLCGAWRFLSSFGLFRGYSWAHSMQVQVRLEPSDHVFTTFSPFFLRHQNIRASPCHLSKNEVLSGINHLQPYFFYFTHEWSLVVEQATGTPFGRFLVRSEVLPLVSLCNWKSGWWAERQEGKLKIPATSTYIHTLQNLGSVGLLNRDVNVDVALPEGHTATAEQLRGHF